MSDMKQCDALSLLKGDAPSLPRGWEMKKLGEVCEILDKLRKPITKRDRIEGEYPYYGATGILSYVHKYIFDEKLILIGEDGAKWESGDNSSFIVEGKYWVNNHAHVIRPNRKLILDEWIVYFLNFSDLTEYTTGMTVPKLNQEKMRSIQILIPPLAEQHRIVAILDKAFTAMAKAKANAGQNLKNAKELVKSKKSQIFQNLKIAEGNVPIASVCNEIFAGGDAPKDNFSNEKTEKYKIPIFSNGITNKGLYGYTDIKKVTKPSITISARGTIGHSEIREKCFYPVVRLIVLTPKIDIISLSFLKYVVSNIDFSHSGSSIPQLTVPMIKGYSIPLPKINVQQTIVQKLDALSVETEELEAIYQKKIVNLQELKKSVLQKAFNGGL